MVSSIGATAIRCRAKALTSALTLCPTLIVAGSPSIGSRSASASASGTWPSAGAPNRPVVAGDVPERQVGGLARPDRHADADELGPHLVRRRGLGGERHGAAVADAREPVGERRARRAAPRRGPGRSAAAPPARARPASPAPARPRPSARSPAARCRAPSPPGRRGRGTPSRRARAAARPGRGRAPPSASSGSSSGTSRLERHQRRARCGSARRGRAAPRAASAA